MPVMMDPWLRPIHELVATNVKFFGSGVKRTLELPLSGDGKHAINLIGVQGTLHTGLRRGFW